MNQQNTFPTQLSNQEAETEHNYIQLSHTLVSNPLYHFSIVITKEWKVVQIETTTPSDKTAMGFIGLLRRVAHPRAEIEVNAFLIPREIHPSDWLRFWLENNGYQIETGRNIPSTYGMVGDYLSTRVINGEQYIYRSLAIKDGNRMFLLTCRVLQKDYSVLAEEFLMAIKTFQLLNPTQERFAEPVKIFHVEKPLTAQFLFPASWVYREDSTSPLNGTSFFLLNTLNNKVVIGHFTLVMIPHEYEEDYRGIFQNYLEQIKSNGIKVEIKNLEPLFDVNENLQGVWEGTLSASKDNEALEMRCGVIEHQQAWVLFALIGPIPSKSGYGSPLTAREIWMVNRRAYDIAWESLRFE